MLTVLLHPRTVRAKRGASIHGRCRLRGRLTMDRGVLIFRGLDCVGPVTIGRDTFINSYAYLRPGVEIGCDVALGPYVRLITDTHELGSPHRRADGNVTRGITIGDGAWLGAGVTVLPGITIGNGAVVAAGSTVTRDVDDNALVAGSPAAFKRWLNV